MRKRAGRIEETTIAMRERCAREWAEVMGASVVAILCDADEVVQVRELRKVGRATGLNGRIKSIKLGRLVQEVVLVSASMDQVPVESNQGDGGK